MTLEEYYKIAEERIGQYDTHSFRCKQWLVVVIGALITVAFSFYRGTTEFPWPLFWPGLCATVLVFLIDMSFSHVTAMLIEYTKDLETEMDKTPEVQHVNLGGWGLTARLSGHPDNNWLGLIRFIFTTGITRARTMLFYLAAIIVVGLGVWTPTLLSATPQESVKYPVPPTQAWHGEGWLQPEHQTYLADQTYRPSPCCAVHKPYRCPPPPWWVVVSHGPVILAVIVMAGVYLICGRICKTVEKSRAKKDEETTSRANKNRDPEI